MRTKTIVFILVMILANLTYSQNNISLLDTEKVKDYLELSAEQIKTIVPKIGQIKTIIEEDKKIIAEIKERVKNDDEPGFFEKISVKRGHDKRASQIEDLIDEIGESLNDKQKNKFKNIDKPELKPLDKKEIFGK
ncbi:hypothetical protein ABRY23_00205 [Melioribacteraceae bacterium 4301-Me]|uniref:hypothetical protein n=1 Tax=Pyranulibacter aquaticus TaxID=3163344 RepID=UPI0035981148